jgi:DNA-binding CsgD family transcriptional regulator
MTDDIIELMYEYNKLLDRQIFNSNELDYNLLEYHLRLLESIYVVDNGCISIFDLYQRKHVYYSPKYEDVLGWDIELAASDLNYTNCLIHPDDMVELIKAGIYFLGLGFALPDRTTSKDYKAIFDYRVIGRNQKYVRIIEQQIPLEFDKSGNVWLALSMVDLAPDNNTDKPFRGRLKNHRSGEYYYFPPKIDFNKKSFSLTNREKEILELIATGLISKEIADKLYISVNTVNTHRQRIIEKLSVNNTYEAIRYANERGLF